MPTLVNNNSKTYANDKETMERTLKDILLEYGVDRTMQDWNYEFINDFRMTIELSYEKQN